MRPGRTAHQEDSAESRVLRLRGTFFVHFKGALGREQDRLRGFFAQKAGSE